MSRFAICNLDRVEKEFMWSVCGLQNFEFPSNCYVKTENFPLENSDESWFIKLMKDGRNLSFSFECENLPSFVANFEVKIVADQGRELCIEQVMFSPDFCSKHFYINDSTMVVKFKVCYEIIKSVKVKETDANGITNETYMDNFSNKTDPNAFNNETDPNAISNEVYSNAFSNETDTNAVSNEVYSNNFNNEVYPNAFNNEIYPNGLSNGTDPNAVSNEVYSNAFSNETDPNAVSHEVYSNAFSNETPGTSSEDEVIVIEDDDSDDDWNVISMNESVDGNIHDEENNTANEDGHQTTIDDGEEEEFFTEDQFTILNASSIEETSSVEEESEEQAAMINDPRTNHHIEKAFEKIPAFLDIINNETPEKWEHLQNLWRDFGDVGLPKEVLNVWETALSDHITLENFFNMFTLAYICKFEKLKEFIITDFISEYENEYEELFNSDGWKELESGENRCHVVFDFVRKFRECYEFL
ncbi:CLUMA_CG007778, isoform A [Clunio marinus]|uniref:CLUMA_CG007774, isoform A n=1 Tax=Clunio marinus TaxID=568069 RepID=A0A1J1I3T8_9DIPT|nr:CLUMA_CG007774, isoform A [Clunio marinus]CRK94260.1 CLUMA_CG007775, isoform A [Clunio marinus]CRK94261.1 CLUMA_CG007776, isoform A [Clunio marinus]CRK94262.1 CLUMA_CG007777, isoform A [Clunio marinus]CRK94263.1 CLUMA_CG007778, isoform A [Clunio marinus]